MHLSHGITLFQLHFTLSKWRSLMPLYSLSSKSCLPSRVSDQRGHRHTFAPLPRFSTPEVRLIFTCSHWSCWPIYHHPMDIHPMDIANDTRPDPVPLTPEQPAPAVEPPCSCNYWAEFPTSSEHRERTSDHGERFPSSSTIRQSTHSYNPFRLLSQTLYHIRSFLIYCHIIII